jgi:hypothetical protein
MPFALTTITVLPPTAATNPLVDPTFYIDYAGGLPASSEARAFLARTVASPTGTVTFLIDLGSPIGGQNRVIARGAQPDDRLCVFDRPRAQFGCETVAAGDDQLTLRSDPAWAPVVRITPVTSVTLGLTVAGITPSLSIRARLYPEYGTSPAPITLSPVGDTYAGTFPTLSDPILAGHVQVWIDEPASEESPRHETILAFTVGGNPGTWRGSGGTWRGSGGTWRGSGGTWRGSGGTWRGSGAPVASPDGQMILFTENPVAFEPGEFFTIQGMAALPAVPPGRTVVGQAYDLIATPPTAVITGSVTFQYLSNDVIVAGADEDQLSVYFYNGSAWEELPTTRNAYFNMATAASRGAGLYALMASLKVPLTMAGWNLVAYPLEMSQTVASALASIAGQYTHVYGYVPADPDHWKVYAPPPQAPDWINDLTWLEPMRGYWINALIPTVLHLSQPAAAGPANGWAPPTTVYGVLQPDAGFSPDAGQLVEARLSGQVCGTALTRSVGDQIVYAVDVVSADEMPNCGRPGHWITFTVAGVPVAGAATWDNNRLVRLDLPGNPFLLYLPRIAR